MSNTISDAVGKLSIITKKTPIDWCAFDSVLKNLENINGYVMIRTKRRFCPNLCWRGIFISAAWFCLMSFVTFFPAAMTYLQMMD